VEPLAKALEDKGWSVWWDRVIPAGKIYDDVIQEKLDEAKCVIVVWSKHSVTSRWVRSEAEEGANRQILVPVLLEEVRIPLAFRPIQAAGLIDWKAGAHHSGFDQFIRDVSGILGPPREKEKEVEEPVSPDRRRADPVKPLPPKSSGATGSPPESEKTQAGASTSGTIPKRVALQLTSQQLTFLVFGLIAVVAVGGLVYTLSTRDQGEVAEQIRPTDTRVSQPVEQDSAPQSVSSTQYKTITSSDDAPMVLVPAGKFWRGSKWGEGGKDERPRRQITLDGFYIDQHEVTVGQYDAFLSTISRENPYKWDEKNLQSDKERPVIGVSWEDAEAYCEWAGKRLPTEAEWEKAASWDPDREKQRKYPWGDETPTNRHAKFGKSWEGYQTLSEVGSYEAGKSPYGIDDMAGNVWEWVADWYDKNYYKNSPDRNPKGLPQGDYRVLRGGSWNYYADSLRSANRFRNELGFHLSGIGFRCAQDAR